MIAAALLVLGVLGLSSAASAGIVSPASGSAITANGRVTLRGSIVNTVCPVVLRGTVGPGTPLALTVTNITGGSSTCSIGTLTIRSVGIKSYGLTNGRLNGTWRIDNLVATLVAPIVGTCNYSGSLSGTWVYDEEQGTVLTVTGNTLTLDTSTSGPLCIARPIVTGTITLLGVVTA